MKNGFWTRDWLVTVIIIVLLLVTNHYTSIFQRLDLLAYDLGSRFGVSTQTHADIRIIAIDDHSIEQLGPWPWPRNYHAQLLDQLNVASPNVIALTIPFDKARVEPALTAIRDSLLLIEESSLTTAKQDIYELDRLMQDMEQGSKSGKSTAVKKLKSSYMKSSLRNRLSTDLNQLSKKLHQAEALLDSDEVLSRSIKHNQNVLLSLHLNHSAQPETPSLTLPDYILPSTLRATDELISSLEQKNLPASVSAYIAPLPKFALSADGLAYLGGYADLDGIVRKDSLVVPYADKAFFPSLSLRIAAQSHALDIRDIYIKPGTPVQIGGLALSTGPSLQMRTRFSSTTSGDTSFPVDSFADVLSGKIPLKQYQDKIILIGRTAKEITPVVATPVSTGMPSVMLLAYQVSNILNNDFIKEPSWSQAATLSALATIALYLILILPRLKIRLGLEMTVLLGVTLLATEYYFLNYRSEWLPLMLPLSLLLIGHAILAGKSFILAERAKIQSAQEYAENNRMLALAYLEQGQLDMALSRLRKIPLDIRLMELLYQQGQKFEQKRQFDQAHRIYSYIAEFNTRYRDLQNRLASTRDKVESLNQDSKNGTQGNGLLLLGADDDEKPMLGRYVVEKELGKGAMGMVYQGKDPKISRKVAIKTMAWSKDLSEEELKESKTRFFREAETAGSLNHPNIITIYDAGEEHDLAYIAMEFINGKNLMDHTRPLNLLPPIVVLDLIVKCADALDYAHMLNVVHRDIKPANIMVDSQARSLKITDFGIARITNSSKTNTGMVLGTPSYMSPEQLAGEKVDGRSDLFSLGVTLFQLLTGRLPFQADTMATLMYKIANEEHLDITMLRPELPACVAEVVNKMLQKAAEDRYQSGKALADDIRRCIPLFSQGDTI
jgi:serine/threonine-protein kinase